MNAGRSVLWIACFAALGAGNARAAQANGARSETFEQQVLRISQQASTAAQRMRRDAAASRAGTAQESREALAALEDPGAGRQVKASALGAFVPFTPRDAVILLGFMDREPEAELREQAAFRLHGMFSYLEPASPYRAQALAFLSDPGATAVIGRRVAGDASAGVRRRLIEFISTVQFGFDAREAEGLAAAYVPILLPALADMDVANREEALFALTQFEESQAYRSPMTRQALQARLSQESDPALRERLEDILANPSDFRLVSEESFSIRPKEAP